MIARQTARSFATSARRLAASPSMGIAQAQGVAKGLTGGASQFLSSQASQNLPDLT